MEANLSLRSQSADRPLGTYCTQTLRPLNESLASIRLFKKRPYQSVGEIEADRRSKSNDQQVIFNEFSFLLGFLDFAYAVSAHTLTFRPASGPDQSTFSSHRL